LNCPIPTPFPKTQAHAQTHLSWSRVVFLPHILSIPYFPYLASLNPTPLTPTRKLLSNSFDLVTYTLVMGRPPLLKLVSSPLPPLLTFV
jgi:hypothetical protein